jgi:hypothetical protein
MLPVTRTGNATKDMSAIMERVRKMSDSQLADILAGKDVSIPQFAAMTEAMGRKQLRQAVDGAQAQQQAQQPSIKEQLLAEQSGLAALPAPNMESMDMAAGGIIAFEDGGEVPRYNGTEEEQLIRDRQRRQSDMWKRAREENEKSLWNTLFGKGLPGLVEKQKKEEILATPLSEPPVVNPEDPFNRANAAKLEAEPAQDDGLKLLNKETTTAAPPTPGADNPDAARNPAAAAKAAYERRANPFTMSAEPVDMEGIKSRGLGEGLMAASQALLSKRGAAGLGDAFAALGKQAGMTRKEVSELKKDARDYDLLRTRAREAFEQGQDELGYKYEKMAQDKELGLAQIGKMGQSSELQVLRALQRPGEDLNDVYARIQGAKQEPKSRAQLEKAWAGMKPGQRMIGYNNDVEKFIEEQMRLSQGLGGSAKATTSGKFTYLGTE